MKVSIIVPVYNTAPYLDRCISSLLNQTHNDAEIILVNDGSADNSDAICRSWREKDSRIIDTYKPRESEGPSAARNAGLNVATGEYICFADSDDCVSPVYVEKLLAMATENDVKMAVCGYAITDETTPVEQIPVPLMLYNTEIITRRSYFERIYTPIEIQYVSVWAKIYHRSLFENIRFEEGKLHEDEGIITSLAARCENMAVCDEPLYFYTVRPGSIMRSYSFNPQYMDIFPFWQVRMEYLQRQGWDDLVYFTMRNYMVRCLQMYNQIDENTPDGDMYKNHLMRMYKNMLSQAKKCSVKSKKFLLKMDYYGLFPGKFKNVDRKEFLFR